MLVKLLTTFLLNATRSAIAHTPPSDGQLPQSMYSVSVLRVFCVHKKNDHYPRQGRAIDLRMRIIQGAKVTADCLVAIATVNSTCIILCTYHVIVSLERNKSRGALREKGTANIFRHASV